MTCKTMAGHGWYCNPDLSRRGRGDVWRTFVSILWGSKRFSSFPNISEQTTTILWCNKARKRGNRMPWRCTITFRECEGVWSFPRQIQTHLKALPWADTTATVIFPKDSTPPQTWIEGIMFNIPYHGLDSHCRRISIICASSPREKPLFGIPLVHRHVVEKRWKLRCCFEGALWDWSLHRSRVQENVIYSSWSEVEMLEFMEVIIRVLCFLYGSSV